MHIEPAGGNVAWNIKDWRSWVAIVFICFVAVMVVGVWDAASKETPCNGYRVTYGYRQGCVELPQR